MQLLTKTCPPIDSAGFLHLVENQPYRFHPPRLSRKQTETRPRSLNPSEFTQHALPAERLRLAARLFCQGSPLRSDKRIPRALDSADG
jgi:hypothetical protein